MNESISAVAAMITGAWEQAGRPACRSSCRELHSRIRRPK